MNLLNIRRGKDKMDRLVLRTNGTLYGYLGEEVVYKEDLLTPSLKKLKEDKKITSETILETVFSEIKVGQWISDEIKNQNS